MYRNPALASCLLASTALVGFVALTPLSVHAQSLPGGGQVVSGGITIGSPSNGSLSINQSTQNAIINWQSFNVGAGQSVNISQPNAAAALLNRVTGSTGSSIAGQINANGQVFLVNPNGIVISSSGRISAAGGFVASTLDLTDEDFNAGRLNFSGDGTSAGVSNAGLITVGAGGYAALIGGQVSNTGVISVPMGRVGLGSSEAAVLDLSGDGFLQVSIPTASEGEGALIQNSGALQADGGHVVLTAAAARDMARQTVNMSGVIEARSVSGRNGSITLSGGEGTVAVSGRLDVSGADRAGGAITVTGGDIALTGAVLDASGQTAGGSIRVGGDWQGRGPLQRARITTIDADTRIRADATASGDGGRVVVWSDDRTAFAGTITARGGALSGDGGQVEVSGKAHLNYTGFTDLTAANGAFGDLLLDPYNITVSTGADTGGFTAGADDSIINVSTLETALGAANVTVSTGSGGSQAGDITLAAPISWNAASTLTLEAAGSIAINQAITAPNGGLTLTAGVGISAGGAVDLGTFTLTAGSWSQNAASLPDFSAMDFRVSGGSFLRVTGGDGSAGSPWQVADVYGLQGIGRSSAHLAGHWALANDIDAGVTRGWTDVDGYGWLGFRPIGLNDPSSPSSFSGSLDGNGHIISGLFSSGWDYGGLIVDLAGTVRHLGVVNADMPWISEGGIVAGSSSGTLEGVHSSGSIAGGIVGGLVGRNSGSISNSHSSAEVSGGPVAGGVVGWADGPSTISTTYASGRVVAGGLSGGIAGINGGSISHAYSLAEVTGNVAGGIAGQSYSSLSNTYASGRVTATGQFSAVGGIVGNGFGSSASANYFDTETTGLSVANGGVAGGFGTGLTTAQARDAASYTGWDFNSDWFHSGDMRPILQAEAAASVNGVTTITNLHQLALMGRDLNGQYRLGANIDAGATVGSDPAGIWSSRGWVPVGSFNTGWFTGFFDGEGHVINGLTIARPTDSEVGLFGRSEGLISNVGLSGGSVTGNFDTGALVGNQISGGIIRNAWASAAVTAYDTAGGLVGENEGQIERSYSSGVVTVSNTTAGGLVGYNGGSIANTYATASVSGIFAGGLVGGNEGNIASSWASGAISGSAPGGLVGAMVGGGTVSASYFDAQGTGQAGAVGSAGTGTIDATALTTAQMEDPFTFIDGGWDFDTVWARNRSGGAPVLRALSNPDDVFDYYIRFGSISRAYGDTLDPALVSVTGVGASNVTLNWDPSINSATNVGTYRFDSNDPIILAFSTGSAGDYYVDYSSGALTITPRPITVTADAISRLYGDANPAPTYAVGGQGLANGDTLSGALATTASTTSNIGTYGITRGTLGAGNSNYAITYTGANLSVTARPITVIADTLSRGFGDANPALTWTVGGQGLANGDTLTGALATTATTTSNVGTYGITVGTLAASSNYTFSFTGANLTVTPRAINVTANALSRLYGETNPALTWTASGLIGSDTLSGALSTTATSTSNVGTYGITQGSLAASANYALNYTGSNLSVTPRSATVTANGASRTYGDANPALTYVVGGLITGDTLTGALSTTASVTSGVGTYAITQGSLTNSNYALAYTGANLTVTPRAITVAADAISRAYGDTNPALTFTVGGRGLANGDSVAGSLATTASVNSNVGSYGITQGNLWVSPNYALSFTGANLTVTPRTVNVTADAFSRVYGETNPALTWIASGLINGDTLSGGLATTATSTSNVGTYGIVLGSLAASTNYALNYTGANLTITPRAATVTANAASRAYGDADPALTWTAGGLINGDTLGGALSTTASAASDVGVYGITQGSLGNANYTLTYTGADLTVTPRAITVTADSAVRSFGDTGSPIGWTVGGAGLVNGDRLTGSLALPEASAVGTYAVTRGTLAASSNYTLGFRDGSLTITPRAVTVMAGAQSRLYGEANPILTWTVSGLLGGETLTGTLTTTATAGSNVGTYAITQGTLAAPLNYTLNYIGAALTVTPRPVVVAANAQSRIYGDANPVLTYTGGQGLLNGDTLTGTLATTAAAGSNVGAYGITQGTLSASANYRIDYTGATLTVGQRGIVVSADPQTRLFGAANPTFTWTVGGAGLANGDTLTGSLSSDALPESPGGQYAIVQGTLAASANYNMAFQDGVLTVRGLPPIVSPVASGGGSFGTGATGNQGRNTLLMSPPAQPDSGAAGAANEGGSSGDDGTNGEEGGGSSPLVSDARFDGLVVCAGAGDCVLVTEVATPGGRPAA